MNGMNTRIARESLGVIEGELRPSGKEKEKIGVMRIAINRISWGMDRAMSSFGKERGGKWESDLKKKKRYKGEEKRRKHLPILWERARTPSTEKEGYPIQSLDSVKSS